MATPPAHAISCLKDAGRQSVWLIQRPQQTPRTLKTWPLSPGLIAKLALGMAQPQRQIRGARRLAAVGVSTPAVVGSWRFARRGRVPVIELELDHVEGRTALELLGPGTTATARQLHCAARLGAFVNAIGSARLLHRDLKLRNVIVDEDGGRDDAGIWIIDPVGVRRTVGRVRAFVYMFDRLMCEAAAAGITLPRPLWRRVIRAGLAPQPAAVRRSVIRRLRSHIRGTYDVPVTQGNAG